MTQDEEQVHQYQLPHVHIIAKYLAASQEHVACGCCLHRERRRPHYPLDSAQLSLTLHILIDSICSSRNTLGKRTVHTLLCHVSTSLDICSQCQYQVTVYTVLHYQYPQESRAASSAQLVPYIVWTSRFPAVHIADSLLACPAG